MEAMFKNEALLLGMIVIADIKNLTQERQKTCYQSSAEI